MPPSVADAIFWIAVACCSIAQLALVRSIVISPTVPPGAGAESGVRPAASAGRRAAELAWVVLPAIALAIVFVFTWRAMHPGAIAP
jgi:heme/copper-type cytochrome/quinol oxidase subunit 2